MIFVRIIDENGFFLEDEPHYEGELTKFIITEPCPGGFYLPRWDGTQWIEGKTQAEIAAIKAAAIPTEPTSDERIDNLEMLILGMEGII